jgi:5-carboxymethyl-2-hydroxymuconic-semialdehyde dehydrogenase
MSAALEANIQKANGYLARWRAAPLGHFIAGRAESGSSRDVFDNISPVDGSVLNQVSSGNERDVDTAATAAQRAFPAWRERSGDERRAILHKVADLIESRREQIAFVECMDTGQALRCVRPRTFVSLPNALPPPPTVWRCLLPST